MSKTHFLKTLNLPIGNAICYSGYRIGQSPDTGVYPSYDEIHEDLLILSKNSYNFV